MQIVVKPLIAFMQANLGAGLLFHLSRAENMIEVRVGVKQVFNGQSLFVQARNNLVDITAWIDNNRFFRFRTRDYRAVCTAADRLETFQ